jgi:membrane protease YdiL (CAAX protease family)
MANALIEEVIYRGMLQPAFVHAAGIARGLWIQGLMFGMLHWGMSVGVVAALPTSLLIGIGSVFWGKAVLDTRGLSWVIVAHAMIDLAIMCAYFVPRS